MEVKDKNYIIISIACLFTYTFYLVIEYILTGGNLGVPLDDSWIHFRFAENFANGDFFQFNPGEPTAGTTSPLWVVLLGSAAIFTDNLLEVSVFLSALFHFLSCIFIYKISLFVFRSEYSPVKDFGKITPEFLSLTAALLTVLAGRFAWSALSGMETTLFTFLSLAGVYVYISELSKENFSLAPFLLFALATTARPEGFLLSGLFMLNLFIELVKKKKLSGNLLTFFSGIMIFCIISLPYLIFSFVTSGHFFPNTYRGQGGAFSLLPNMEYLGMITALFLEDNILICLLFISILISYFILIKKYFTSFKYVNLILQWVLFLPIVSAFVAPNWRHHGRYLIPLIPFICFAGIFILSFYLSLLRRNSIKKIFTGSKVVISLILVFSVSYYIIFAIALGLNTDNINNQQVKLALWVKENVPENDTIALNDIGAITYMTKNHVVDMAGLVTPEFLRYRTYSWDDNLDSMFYLLRNNNVSYIIIYDHWFEEFLNKYGNYFEFIHSEILEVNTICGGEEMKVYKTNFYRRD